MTRFPSARLNHKATLAFMQRSAFLAGALVAAALTGAQANAAGDGLYQSNAGVEAFIGGRRVGLGRRWDGCQR